MSDTTTDAQEITTRQVRRGRLGRRIFAVAVTVFLALGLLGLFGTRTRTMTSGDATLTYTQTSRRGLPTTWELELSRPEGFGDQQVTVRTSADYWDAVEVHEILPEPSSVTTDGDEVVWTFDPPSGAVFRASVAGEVAGEIDNQASAGRKPARASVQVGDDEPTTFGYRTWVLP